MKKFSYIGFAIYSINGVTFVKVPTGSTRGQVVDGSATRTAIGYDVEATWTPDSSFSSFGTLIEQPNKQLIQNLANGIYANSETGRVYLRLDGITYRETDEGKFVVEERNWNLRLEKTHNIAGV